MPYTSASQIAAAIPGPALTDALDDDRDQVADPGLLDTIIAQASQTVDAFLASIYDVPFADPAPAPVKEAAFVFACELIYARRERTGDENPFTKRANAMRDLLKQIGSGKQPLAGATPRSFTPGAAITECISVNGSMR